MIALGVRPRRHPAA